MRKAGIFIGVLFLVAAVLIYWVTSGSSKPANPSVQAKAVTTVSSSKSSANPEPVVKATPSSSSTSSANESTQEVSAPNSSGSFVSISPSSLGKPVNTTTEIMVVSKKKVLVLTKEINGTKTLQLAYALDLLYSQGYLTFFLSGDDFATISVGQKLKVTYAEYQNASGVLFPVILKVSLLS